MVAKNPEIEYVDAEREARMILSAMLDTVPGELEEALRQRHRKSAFELSLELYETMKAMKDDVRAEARNLLEKTYTSVWGRRKSN
ncbi:hypothetical protein A3A67_04200 [Candidatus Peribacteria bacterium RIFCSPLOWO2_01_FULL_51_18]|nr:MAG: hypothetical protein A3C52_04080 [Candidatus Peribacteria bacterium RIFCSPHIGHO2_02_FULL_51_15]OGJ65832.1 MAG: hypothetical protein A3A67_04200 [Candidatus Peribacteria bacterium RIFCSPLOWO2_01_FULL_51_18]OGJ68441.1 MAG: hypothetical protein A3J34_04615 [Candidatus Peribacteria bacterium RIFCSPLOWO2_02_FULL_51_10]